MTTIRSFAGSDITEIVKVWNVAMPYNAISKEAFIKNFVLDHNFDEKGFFVAEHDGEIIGFIYALVRRFPVDVGAPAEDEFGYINAIGLKYEDDVLILGKELIAKAEEYIKLCGKETIQVSKYTPLYIYQGINSKYELYVQLFNEMGYDELYRNCSRSIDLLNYVRPKEIDELKAQREKEGFIFTDMKDEYILKLMKYYTPGWTHRFRRLLLETIDYTKFNLIVYKDEVIGACVFGDTYSCPERYGPYSVDENYRGLGLGKILARECFTKMKEQGLQCAWAQSTPISGAASFVYDKIGFKQTAEYIMFTKKALD